MANKIKTKLDIKWKGLDIIETSNECWDTNNYQVSIKGMDIFLNLNLDHDKASNSEIMIGLDNQYRKQISQAKEWIEYYQEQVQILEGVQE